MALSGLERLRQLTMTTGSRNLLVSVACMVAIGLSAYSILRQSKAPSHNQALHQYVGKTMAEQAARVAGQKGRVVYITIPTRGEPELATQLEAFRQELKKLGDFELDEQELDTKDQPKYGLGNGLSGRRLVRTANKHQDAAVLVSFVGAPDLTDQEIGELKKVPKFVAQTRSPDHLPKLFDRKILQVAIVSRFIFPSPGPESPSTPQEWFDKRYQLITPDLATNLFTPVRSE